MLFGILPALAQKDQIWQGHNRKRNKYRADDNFNLQPLGAGTYAITAEKAAINTLQRMGINLDVQILNLGNFEMGIGATAEQMTVEANSPLVESATSQKSFTITSKQVQETALNGRHLQLLIRTALYKNLKDVGVRRRIHAEAGAYAVER